MIGENCILKRVITFILALSMLLSIVACAKEEKAPSQTDAVAETAGVPTTVDGSAEKDPSNENPAEKHKVTLKNSDGTVLSEQEIPAGTYVSEPVMPTVEGYTFIGWFESPESEQAFDFNTAITSDVTLFAKWEGNKIPGVEITPTQIEADYQIIQLNVNPDSKQITALISAKSDCRVLVRFAEEDAYFSDTFQENKQYIEGCSAEGSVTVTEESKNVEITMSITGELPQRFVADAVLLDADGNQISASLFNIKNTSRYEIFDQKTVDDFSNNKQLLNFDERKDQNFGVLADDVKMLTAKSIDETPLNNDGDIFYFITGLSGEISVGDKIYVKAENGAEALLKVGSTTSNNNGISVVPVSADGENGYGLSDFYQFLKVDMTSFGSMNPDNAVQPRSAVVSTKEYDKTFEINKEPFKIEHNDLTFTTNIDGTITLECSYLYDPTVFGEDYFECSVIVDTDLEFTASLSFEASSEGEDSDKQEREDISFVKVPTPIFAGFSPKLELGFIYEWEVSASVKAGLSFEKRLGFKYDPVNEMTKISEKADIKPIVEFEGEAKLVVGPTVSLGVDFLKGIASANIEVVRGVELKATTKDNEQMAAAGAQHDCYFCASGSVNAFWDVDATLKIKLTKKLEWTILKLDILNTNLNLYTATCSKETEDSKLKFTEGDCKNYSLQFSIWRALDCPCFLYQDNGGFPENIIELDRSCPWEITIYKNDVLIASAADDGGHGEREPRNKMVLKYGETYKVVLKQTCDVTYTACSCGGLHLDTCTPTIQSFTLNSTVEYLGKWELKEVSGVWYGIFYYTTEDNTPENLSKVIRPLQKHERN